MTKLFSFPMLTKLSFVSLSSFFSLTSLCLCSFAFSRILARVARGFLFFLVGVGLLVLTACSGGGGGGGGGAPSPPSELRFTFTPVTGGFIIDSRSDLSRFKSLRITATTGEESNWYVVPITVFSNNNNFRFGGLNDRLYYTFAIGGILNDGTERDLEIDFVWEENEYDHNERGGIRPGFNTDRDGRANSVDTDDDNDGVKDVDEEEGCELKVDCDGDGADDGDEGCILETDCDRDGVLNNRDVDIDGDGLIEIATAEQLDGVRYALDGSGRKLSAEGRLDTNGCGGRSGINSCNGYELTADIDLADYIENTYGAKGWQPLGHDIDGPTLIGPINGCQGDAFDGIFRGNGWMISGLSINRPDEDCVGLFGALTFGSEIRDLIVQVEEVVGNDYVGGMAGWGLGVQIISSSVEGVNVSGQGFNTGGLVGYGESAQIISSSVELSKVRGKDSNTGGLVGYGPGADILYSSVVAGEVSGDFQSIGGLVGSGVRARILSSLVVVGEVSGTVTRVGGLVGNGPGADIFSSSVVVGKISGKSYRLGGGVGGMVGYGLEARIYSSSVVLGEMRATGGYVGGMLGGDFGIHSNSVIAYSYMLLGGFWRVNMLARGGGAINVTSYWDSETSNIDTGSLGNPKTSDELRMPIDYKRINNKRISNTSISNTSISNTDIYATWDDGVDIDNMDGDNNIETGIDYITIYCDEDMSGDIEKGENRDDNRIWDFGTSTEYPAIRCLPISPSEWRSWWSLSVTGKPRLNRARLDDLLAP